MLNTWTTETFLPLLHDSFLVTQPEGEILTFELVEVFPLGLTSSSDPAGGRQAFSLHFRGPIRPVLSQRIYEFSNATLGQFEIFIVPIGPKEGGMTYEAIFT